MAAIVLIREKNGAGETATDKTSGTVRFKNADNATVDLVDPLVVPGSGQEYSFRKSLRMHVDSGGSYTQISNLRAYSDGANGFGTGVKAWYALTGTYTQGTVPTESNDPPQFPGATPMVDWFGTNSGAPADMDAINTGPVASGGEPKDIGDYLNLVMEVEPTASQGVLSAETATVSWDEI
jgi:hypothetical protein